jgi:hypothetical protein
VLTAFKLNETSGAFDRAAITNSLVEGSSGGGRRGHFHASTPCLFCAESH